jgi:hypothetical protein
MLWAMLDSLEDRGFPQPRTLDLFGAVALQRRSDHVPAGIRLSPQPAALARPVPPMPDLIAAATSISSLCQVRP